MPLHFSGGPYYWHCDDADYLEGGNYPQDRAEATAKLLHCRTWAYDMLHNGFDSGTVNAPTWGAVEIAKNLLDAKGRVDVYDPGTGPIFPYNTCTFLGQKGRAKCMAWEPFGYVLHATEDFYSHSNWADLSEPGVNVSITNPPGLGHRDLPAFWDLRNVHAVPAIPDNRLTTGCYPSDECTDRILHGDSEHPGLNKDLELINTTTGFVSDPTTPRGKILDNAQRAVNDAINEARRQWAIFRWELVKRYGDERGGKMICALSSDKADKQCNDPTRARFVFAAIPPPFVQLASVVDGHRCLDIPNSSTASGTQLQMFDCNGTAAQQFRFASKDVQFTSTGTGQVQAMGKCLDAPTAAAGARVQIYDCNGTVPQQVTVTSAGQLQMRGLCLSLENRRASNGAPAILAACGATDNSQIWQFR